MMESQPPPNSPTPASSAPAPGIPATPPPIIPPPIPSVPRNSSRKDRNGWRIAALILAAVVVVGIFGNLGKFALRTVRSVGLGTKTHVHNSRLIETVIEDNDSRDKIVVIPIEGVISGEDMDRGGNSLVDLVEDQLRLAQDDKHVKAVLLKINSPGGEVLASDDIYRALRRFQEESDKPVIASMGGLAASGGYYVAAPCRWIVANELSITGSIGVIMHGYNYRGLMDKVGLRPQVYKSGRFKDMLSPDKNLDTTDAKEKAVLEEEGQMVQNMINQTFERFKQIVGEGRGMANQLNQDEGRKLKEHWADYADGRILSGKDAYELGFVDELGNWETAVERAEILAGIGLANLVTYQPQLDFSNLLRFLGKSESKSLRVEIGPETPRLPVGRLYFLPSMYAH